MRALNALANVDFINKIHGVMFAQGSQFGGCLLLVEGGHLCVACNFMRIPREQQLRCHAPTDGKHT